MAEILIIERVEVYHVSPENDLKPHILRGTGCACKPVISENHDNTGATLVIHNSFDGREFFEAENEVRC